MEDQAPTVTPSAVAKLLGKHISTIHRAVKRGDIKSIDIGGNRLIPRAEYVRLESELKKLEVTQ